MPEVEIYAFAKLQAVPERREFLRKQEVAGFHRELAGGGGQLAQQLHTIIVQLHLYAVALDRS